MNSQFSSSSLLLSLSYLLSSVPCHCQCPTWHFIKEHYCSFFVYHLYIWWSNDDVPSSTCFIVHASCTEEFARFVHCIYCLLSIHAMLQQRTINYQSLWGSPRLAPINGHSSQCDDSRTEMIVSH